MWDDKYYRHTKAVLSQSMVEDLEWLKHGRVPGQKPDPINNPWMPFQMADFVAIMTECVAESEGHLFLDIGSGIGTKMCVAEALFGLQPYGVEYDDKMVDHADEYDRGTTIRGDALLMEEIYKKVDIIWMYRPYRDALSQAKLEHKIFELMKPGAIIAGSAWESQPPGFEIVVDDCDPSTGMVRGAWKKPLNWQTVNYEN